MNIKTLLFFLFFLFFLPLSVSAQRQIDDYTYHYDKYRRQYEEYSTAKNEYLKQNTLTAQNEALDKTKTIIAQRAAAMRAYLMALRYVLIDTTGITNEDKSALVAKIDEEAGWLQNQIDDINGMNSPTLTDLFVISARFERKQEIFVSLGYKSIIYVLIGRERDVNQQYTATNTALRTLVEKHDNSFLKNWYAQAVDVSYRCEQNINTAQNLAKEIGDDSDEDDALDVLSEVKTELNKGKQMLVNGIAYQQEIIKELNKIIPDPTILPGLNQVPTASTSAN